MKKPMQPRGGLKRLLAQSLFASASVVAAPTPAIAASTEGRVAPDVSSDDRDDAIDQTIDITDDPEHVAAGGRRLATRLARMKPLDATELAVAAALDSNVEVRRSLAEALVVPFRLLGDDFMLDQLAHDPDVEVRDAAARACIARGIAPPSSTQAALVHEPAHPRVLVIDDYPGGRAALCACLSELGCDAMGASSRIASRAVDWRELVDIVVANHEPPWSDGPKIIGELRRRAPDLPAIVLRYPITEAESSRVEMPDEITLVKPLALEDLATAIHALAAKTLHAG